MGKFLALPWSNIQMGIFHLLLGLLRANAVQEPASVAFPYKCRLSGWKWTVFLVHGEHTSCFSPVFPLALPLLPLLPSLHPAFFLLPGNLCSWPFEWVSDCLLSQASSYVQWSLRRTTLNLCTKRRLLTWSWQHTSALARMKCSSERHCRPWKQ